MKNSTRKIALILLFFNALSALFGGGVLIYDPSGEMIQMPIEFLEHSSFKNFLIPGIILFTMNGVFNLYVGILGIRKYRFFPELTILCGLLLIAWLTIEIIIIKQFYALAHIPYYLTGIFLCIVGLKLRNQNIVN